MRCTHREIRRHQLLSIFKSIKTLLVRPEWLVEIFGEAIEFVDACAFHVLYLHYVALSISLRFWFLCHVLLLDKNMLDKAIQITQLSAACIECVACAFWEFWPHFQQHLVARRQSHCSMY